MKANSLRSWGLVTVLVVTGALGNGQSLCAQTNSSSATISSPAPSPSPPSSSLPSFIMPTSPAAQVIRLVQAGVEENIVLSYVSNSSSTFNLDSDKIIYLSDVGVPGDVTTAMMQRDQVLQQQMAAAQPIQTAPPPPPPPSSTATYITDSTDASDATDATPPADTSPITVNYFYDSWRRMAHGWIFPDTDAAGVRPSPLITPAGSPIATVASGFTPMPAGIGNQDMPGVSLFIMDAGFAIPTSAGAGGPTQAGVRRG